MEVACSSCLNRRDCDFVVTDNEGNWVPDEGAFAGECPHYAMDTRPLQEAGARQATVERVAGIVRDMYPDHRVVQAYIRVQRVMVPAHEEGECGIDHCGNCPEADDCDLIGDPVECGSCECEVDEDTEPVMVPGEYTKFVININTAQKLTDEEGIIRQQEIQQRLQDLNDEEMEVENCVFEISFVHIEPVVPDCLPADI